MNRDSEPFKTFSMLPKRPGPFHLKVVSLIPAFILLFASLGYFTVIPGFIDNYNLIVASCLAVLFLARLKYSAIKFRILVIFAFYGVLMFIELNSFNFHRMVILIIITLLLLCLTTMREHERHLFVKLYVIFAFVWSISGTISWVLVNFNLVDVQEHIFVLEEHTDGKMIRDVGAAAYYSNPFGLGLVEMAHTTYNVLGFEFLRAAGWAHEPITSALYIGPAFLLILNNNLFSKYINWVMILSLFIYLFIASHSVTSLVAFTLLLCLFLISLFNNWLRCFVVLALSTIFVITVKNVDVVLNYIANISGFEAVPILIKIYYSEYYIVQFDNPILLLGLTLFFFITVQLLSLFKRNKFSRTFFLILLYLGTYIFKQDNTFGRENYLVHFYKLVTDLSFVLWIYLFVFSVFPLEKDDAMVDKKVKCQPI